MIFNSLGSNYTFKFAIKALFSFGTNKDRKKLEVYLEKRYQGKVTLLHKGREAIKLALKMLDLPKGSKVGITGFTCYVAYKAIEESDLQPVYLDIDESLNFLPSKIADVKVLIIQNTLGNPCDIEGIMKVCKEKNIVLIEDLAHSVGTFYEDGREAGTVGDFAALSFSQDKMVDAVSGGALITRSRDYSDFDAKQFKNLDFIVGLKDRLYPFCTYLIRNLYPYGFGKSLHYFLKKLNLLSKPIETNRNITFQNISNWHAGLANNYFKEFDEVLKNRREIASIYAEKLDKKILSRDFIQNLKLSSCLRFPIFVEKRSSLIECLKQNGIFVSDIWYDAPIAPSRLLAKTNYGGECPVSEKISEKIINLPTHVNVSKKEAEFISEKINKWINTK